MSSDMETAVEDWRQLWLQKGASQPKGEKRKYTHRRQMNQTTIEGHNRDAVDDDRSGDDVSTKQNNTIFILSGFEEN